MAILYDNGVSPNNKYSQGTASLPTYPFSENFWFYPTNSGTSNTLVGVVNTQMLVLHNMIDLQRFIIAVALQTKTLLLNTYVTSNVTINTTATYTVNAWNMATLVATSSTSRTIYLNGGNSVTSTSNLTPTTPTRWLLGAQFQTTTPTYQPNFQGRLAEIGIWNVALSADDINALYKGFKPSLVRPQNLRVYLPHISSSAYDVRDTTTTINYDTNSGSADHVRRYG